MTNPQTAPAEDALRLLWPFIADQKGAMLAPGYADAISALAKVLGKSCRLSKRHDGYIYVEYIEP